MRPRAPMRPSMTGRAVDLVVEEDGHLAADVVAGHPLGDRGALAVELERDLGPPGLLIPGLVGVRQVLAGQRRPLVQVVRAPVTVRRRFAVLVAPLDLLVPDLVIGRQGQVAGQPGEELLQAVAALRPQVDVLVRLARVLLGPRLGNDVDPLPLGHGGGDLAHVLRTVVDDLELELRRAADDRLDALEVGRLQAGELDDDVGPLLDDRRLGDAELVDAAADRLDALAKRVVTHLLDLVGIQAQPHDARGRVAAHDVQRLAVVLEDRVVQLGLLGRRLERQDDVVAPLTIDVQVGDALVLVEAILEVGREPIDLAGDRLVDVHLVDEVQAALKVQPQLDALLEVLLNESRLLVLWDDRRDQVQDGHNGDEPVEGRLPPPRTFHECVCLFRDREAYEAFASVFGAVAPV